jgi:hypothetical protein
VKRDAGLINKTQPAQATCLCLLANGGMNRTFLSRSTSSSGHSMRSKNLRHGSTVAPVMCAGHPSATTTTPPNGSDRESVQCTVASVVRVGCAPSPPHLSRPLIVVLPFAGLSNRALFSSPPSGLAPRMIGASAIRCATPSFRQSTPRE